MNITRHSAIPLQQAVDESPTLARLSQLARQSSARMALVRPIIPAPLRKLVQPGVPEPDLWCVLVPHAAAAAKLRQLMPRMIKALQEGGEPVQAIRIKVMQSPH